MAPQSAPVRPIASRSVTELVTAELRRSILSGALAPGQSFSLREIAGMLNVSFIPVREALRNLEAEGLVVIQPGRSATVAPLALADLQAIYRLRRLLEPDLARRSCLLISDAELDRLAGQAVEFGDEDRSMDAIYDGHHEFHLALLRPPPPRGTPGCSPRCGGRPSATSASGSACSTRTRTSTSAAGARTRN